MDPSRSATVFVCYAQDDAATLKQLRVHLASLERDGLIKFWADTEVRPGEDWRARMDAALAGAHSAVLLISAGFLASPAVVDQQLPYLLARHAAGQLKLLPVFVSPSDVEHAELTYRDPVTGRDARFKLTSLQGVGSPSHTLSELRASERERELVKLARRLRELATTARDTAAHSDRGLPAPRGTSLSVRGEETPAAPRPARVRRLELRNVRGFEHLVLDFGDPPRTATALIGRNGTCKTTLLRAIAVAVAGPNDRRALLAHPFGTWLRQGTQDGEINVQIDGEPESRDVYLKKEGGIEIDAASSWATKPLFLCGYGLGRGLAGGEPSGPYRLLDSVATLFRYESRLTPPELELRRLNDFLGQERFARLQASLKRALGLRPEHRIELPSGGGILVGGPGIGTGIPLDAWADGYRMSFLWLVDLFGHARRANAFDAEGDLCGIVLVDEIEQHLHPSMQMGLLPQLRQALPKVQWIVTTHSPLVALSVGQEHLVALHRAGDTVQVAEVPDLAGYSAEDILVEESLFGTDPFGPETRQQLDDQHALLRKDPADRSIQDNADLRSLSAALDPSTLPAVREALRDDPVLAKLDSIEALLKANDPRT
jgi:hypothetical protein